MGDRLLQSMSQLNQYLQYEVGQKREEDKKKLVGKVGAGISSMFADLGPNATPGDITSATFEAVRSAGESGTLNESLGLISTLGQTSLQNLAYQQEQEKYGALAKNLNYKTPGVSNEAAVLIDEYKRNQEFELKEEVGGVVKWTKYAPDGQGGFKAAFSRDIGPSTEAKEQMTFNRQMRVALMEGKIKAQVEAAKGNSLKMSDYKIAYENIGTELSNVSERISNKLKFDPADLKNIVGGSTTKIRELMQNPEALLDALSNADVEPVQIPGSLNAAYTQPASYPSGGITYVDEHGQKRENMVPIPTDLNLQKDFMNFIQLSEAQQNITAQITANSFKKEPRQWTELEETMITSEFQKELEKVVTQPDSKFHGYYNKAIRSIKNDYITPLEQLYKSLTQKEKTILMQDAVMKRK